MGKLRSMRALLSVGALALGAVVLAGGVAGCGSADTGSPSAASFKEGLTILSSDPKVGVSAAFSQAGRVVYFETRVGPLKPEQYLKAFPNEPAYEMDARFVDAHGSTFILQIGGDSLIDATWPSDIAKNSRRPDPGEREQDFQLARVAARAAAVAPELGPAYVDHFVHTDNLTRVLPSERLDLRERMTTAVESLPKEAAYNASTYYNWWEGDLYWKSFALITQHSAVWEWNAGWYGSSYTWDEQVVTCNHGTCANDSSMSYTCNSTYSGGWTSNYYDVTRLSDKEMSTSSGSKTGACTGSNYGIDVADVTVYGSGDANHVCNDDSAQELQSIKNGGNVGGSWSGGAGGNNGSYSCVHWTHWYGPLNSDGYAPNCP